MISPLNRGTRRRGRASAGDTRLTGYNRYMTSDRKAYSDLPIFPLPDTVLFPGGMLPLHVFEPRYVEMTRDVIAGSGVMGIVRLVDDDPAERSIYQVATAAQIAAYQELPDDRFAILVQGVERIHVEHELPLTRSYRRVLATVLEEATAPWIHHDPVSRRELLALCDQLAGRLGEAGSAFRKALHDSEDESHLTDMLATAVVHEPDDRQRLLEQLDPNLRMTLLFDRVSELLAGFGLEPAMAN